MKRILNIFGIVIVFAVIVLFTTCLVISAFVELPPNPNYNLELYDIVWLVILTLAAIYTIWRLLKFTVYQLCFTVTKAIGDAKRNKDVGGK